jgi:hypothetical protein
MPDADCSRNDLGLVQAIGRGLAATARGHYLGATCRDRRPADRERHGERFLLELSG